MPVVDDMALNVLATTSDWYVSFQSNVM